MNTTTQTTEASPYHKRLHYFAVFLTIWTFLVVTLGGVVKSNEAGLTIPEGFIVHWMPDWWQRPNLRLEFAHRMFVGVLGLGVFILTAITLKIEQRESVRRFSKILPVFIVAQAVVGYLTVRFFTKWHTSIPHVALGHAFLASMACFTTMLSPLWTSAEPRQSEHERTPLQKLARALMIAVFIQLLLGATLRHDDQGRALQEDRDWIFHAHLTLHVLGAFMVVHFLAKLLLRVFHDHRAQSQIINPARAIMMLVGVQFMLGPAAAVLKVIYSRDNFDARTPPPMRLWIATSHVIVGALILTFAAVLFARAKRYCAAVEPNPAPQPKIAEASA